MESIERNPSNRQMKLRALGLEVPSQQHDHETGSEPTVLAVEGPCTEMKAVDVPREMVTAPQTAGRVATHDRTPTGEGRVH